MASALLGTLKAVGGSILGSLMKETVSTIGNAATNKFDEIKDVVTNIGKM